MEEKEKRLKLILGASAENTAMHGLPNIKRSASVAGKVFWAIVVLAGLGMIIYEIVLATIKYYEYPVQTNISPETAFSHPFPAITICNQNSIRMSALGNAGSKIYSLLNDTSANSGQTGSARVSLKDSIMKYYTQLSTSTRINIGHQLDNMLVDCSYGSLQCNATYFQTFSNFHYGNCFTFNNGYNQTTLNTSNEGPLYAFEIVLYLEQHEYIGDLTETAGVRVVIHNMTSMPFPEDEGFSAAPGHVTFAGLTRREITRAAHPYGDCEDDNTALNAYLGILNGVDYSKQACKKTCLQYHIIKNCGCGDSSLEMDSPAFNKVTSGTVMACSNATQEACKTTIRDQCDQNLLNCSTGCSSLCFEVDHTRTLSYGLWPSDKAMKSVLANLNSTSAAAKLMQGMNSDEAEDFLRRNTLKILVYFESLDFDSVSTESSYSTSDLAATFGGQMGLWLGMSVCTLFEVVQMFWEMGLVIATKMNSRNNKTSQAQGGGSEKKMTPVDQASVVKGDISCSADSK